MSRLLAYLLALVLLGAVAYSAAAQEVLRPAKIQAAGFAEAAFTGATPASGRADRSCGVV